MAEKPKRQGGLGRNLSDVLGDKSPRTSAGEPYYPWGPDYQPKADLVRGNPTLQPAGGLGGLIPSGDDFGPYTLTYEDEPNYGRGPSASTRVAAHQFVPFDPNWEEYASIHDAESLQEYIYVKFWKPGVNKPNLYRYGPSTLQNYRSFREQPSKGRAVTALEAYGYSPVTNPDPRVQIA